jgi:hypothetical protein
LSTAGLMDYNYVFEDGSATRYTKVRVQTPIDRPMGAVPGYCNFADTSFYQLLPAE